MNCAEIQPLLNAWFDGELDAVRAVDVERHITGCPTCAGAKRSLESLRAALRRSNLQYRAPDSLRDSIQRSVAAAGASASGVSNEKATSTDPAAASVAPSPGGEGRGVGDRDVRQYETP